MIYYEAIAFVILRSGKINNYMFLAEFDLKDNIGYQDILCPAIWNDDNTIKPEVELALLRIAKKFIEYLDYDKFDVFDVRLVGSIANYNYTKFSDVDVHIVTDLREYDSKELAEKFFHAKKSLWNDRHNIVVGAHDVELYVEDLATPPSSSGIYSLLKRKWLKMPEHVAPKYDDRAVKAKTQSLMNDIDRILGSSKTDSEDLRQLREKIWKMRQSAVAKGGEWAVENLAFKILRNTGYLQRLIDTENRLQDQELSI